jgi:hypothetical protein
METDMNNQLAVKGSVLSEAEDKGISIEEAFVQCDVVVMVDVSGSMGDYYEGEESGLYDTCFDAAADALKQLQELYPSRVALLQFSSLTQFRPDGTLVPEFASTNMTSALEMARMADVPGMTFILISDGYPDFAEHAKREARKFSQPIHTIYIGREGEAGQEFLEEIARMSGGKSSNNVEIVQQVLGFARMLLEDKSRQNTGVIAL